MNGRIAAKIAGFTGFDADGNPTSNPTTFGAWKSCKYVSASRNDTYDKGDGNFTQASYVITLNDMDFTATNVVLQDSRGNEVCVKNVKSLEVLESINRVKIVL